MVLCVLCLNQGRLSLCQAWRALDIRRGRFIAKSVRFRLLLCSPRLRQYHSISFQIIPYHSISHPPSVFVSACLLGFAAPGEVALPMLRIWHASRLPCQRTGLLDRHGAAPVTQTIMRRRGCILKPDLGHLNNNKGFKVSALIMVPPEST